MSKRQNLVPWLALAGVVALAVVAVYANSLHNGFVFDDGDLILNDPQIRHLGDVRAMLSDAYRPLRTITYAIDYAIWGQNPMGFRITNIAIHVANCALGLVLARRLTGGARVASVAAVLVFALHPVQVESVAYVSGRRDVLFTLFYLAAFLCFVRFRESETLRQKLGWLAATGVGFALSLMSKEMAASFPLACFLWDLTRAASPADDGAADVARPSLAETGRRLVREGAALYGAGIVALVAFAYYTIFIRRATSRMVGLDIEFWGGSPLNNTLTVPLTYAHYTKLAVWPATLAAQYYGAFDPAAGFADPRVVPALLLLLGLVVVSVYLILRTSHRLVGFGIAWFLITLLPASQILPHHEIVADHYLYLPMLGLGFAIAGGLLAAERAEVRWARNAAYAAVAIALVALSVRTVVRNRDWKDEATLWEATYKAVPESPRAAYNYGLVLTNRGEYESSIPFYKKAIERDPTFVPAYRNLGSTYAGLGCYDDAKAVYKAALAADLPLSARTWHVYDSEVLRASYETEIAMLDAQAGRTAEGRDALAAVLAKYPDLVRAEDAFATVVQSRGEMPATIDAYRARVAADPSSLADRLVLGTLLWKAGRIDDAYQIFSAVADETAAKHQDSALANLYVGRYLREIKPNLAPSPGAAAAHFDLAEARALTPFDRDIMQRLRGNAQGSLNG